jgi:hypothetical protein
VRVLPPEPLSSPSILLIEIDPRFWPWNPGILSSFLEPAGTVPISRSRSRQSETADCPLLRSRFPDRLDASGPKTIRGSILAHSESYADKLLSVPPRVIIPVHAAFEKRIHPRQGMIHATRNDS